MKASRWDINVQDERYGEWVPQMNAFVERLMECLDLEQTELSILLTDDAHIHELNQEYRGIDRPTDVLSFPQEESKDEEGYTHLGDIVISMERAEKQAIDLNHPLVVEVCFLVLHGALHLLGHDHESDDGEMLALQKKLKTQLAEFLTAE